MGVKGAWGKPLSTAVRAAPSAAPYLALPPRPNAPRPPPAPASAPVQAEAAAVPHLMPPPTETPAARPAQVHTDCSRLAVRHTMCFRHQRRPQFPEATQGYLVGKAFRCSTVAVSACAWQVAKSSALHCWTLPDLSLSLVPLRTEQVHTCSSHNGADQGWPTETWQYFTLLLQAKGWTKVGKPSKGENSQSAVPDEAKKEGLRASPSHADSADDQNLEKAIKVRPVPDTQQTPLAEECPYVYY